MSEAVARPQAADYQLPADHPVRRLGQRALVVGVVATALVAYGAIDDTAQFYRSYLVAYLYWIGIALGSLVLLLIHHVAGGQWGLRLRRLLEASTRTLPFFAVLFVPIIFGLHDLYEWTHKDVVAHDYVLQHKEIYLNEPFFLARAAAYFAIWISIAFFLSRWSAQQDERGHTPALRRKFTLLGRGGIVLYALTITFASVDWAMSLEPHWFSTIYGVLFAGGQLLCAMAFMIFMAARLSGSGPLGEAFSPALFHDLGKLLLAFTMLWAYFAFSQFLIIWSGNLPEFIPWYVNRLEGGWEYFSILVILFHFALPFTTLLSRNLKRRALMLAKVAAVVLVMRFVEMYWAITPAFTPKDFAPVWLDLAAFLGVGGLWLALFVRQLQKRPLMPLQDPELP